VTGKSFFSSLYEGLIFIRPRLVRPPLSPVTRYIWMFFWWYCKEWSWPPAFHCSPVPCFFFDCLPPSAEFFWWWSALLLFFYFFFFLPPVPLFFFPWTDQHKAMAPSFFCFFAHALVSDFCFPGQQSPFFFLCIADQVISFFFFGP